MIKKNTYKAALLFLGLNALCMPYVQAQQRAQTTVVDSKKNFPYQSQQYLALMVKLKGFAQVVKRSQGLSEQAETQDIFFTDKQDIEKILSLSAFTKVGEFRYEKQYFTPMQTSPMQLNFIDFSMLREELTDNQANQALLDWLEREPVDFMEQAHKFHMSVYTGGMVTITDGPLSVKKINQQCLLGLPIKFANTHDCRLWLICTENTKNSLPEMQHSFSTQSGVVEGTDFTVYASYPNMEELKQRLMAKENYLNH